MEIILLERVGNLGKIGDIVTVKDGFARNFLLPNKKALRANDANKAVFEANREQLEKDNEERRAAAEKEGSKLEGMTIELIRQASNTGQLYGSVSVRDIVLALGEKGETVTKQQVVLERPIKAIGMYDIAVNLHAEVDVTVKVNVARSPEEAEKQAQGIDIIAEMFEQAQADIVEDFNPDAEPGEIAAIEDEEEDTPEPVPAPQAADAESEDGADEAPAEDAEEAAPAEEAAAKAADETPAEDGEAGGEEKA
ncbi:50S ribosomal protein L9 [Parasphingopyxis marina]|uniref:Large ribosomal subunit protein bL9 n=1 Tax=Parasphingopyxis marina TaxID=2761622 RepID=A0A842HZA2_9SPHN|nr:50S ribosomal protein L9 [Parasphingopyxis marina]